MERARIVAVVAVFGVLGTVLLFHSHASTPTAAFEAESGTVSGCASTASDGSASGSQAAQFGTCGQVTTASSVSQYGITWTFDSAKPVGQFANGDYWVAGPVTITSMSPAYDAANKLNGWQVNPTQTSSQGFDGLAYDFNAALIPSLPYNAVGGQSIVKAVSVGAPRSNCMSDGSCVQKAAVLTVLGSVPANNGSTVFRPPYFGTNKSQFTTSNVDTAMGTLPRLSSTAAIDAKLQTLAAAFDSIKRVPLVHNDSWSGTSIKPRDSFGGMVKPYGPGVSNINADAALRMLIAKPGDSEAERRQIAVALAQYGVDIYGMISGGAHFVSDGGNNLGYRLPMSFAGLMLNNQTIKDAITNSARNDFSETGSVWPSVRPGSPALWGQLRGDESAYWNALAAQNDSSNIRDPYGYIDGGGDPGNTYQSCCTTSALKASAMIVHLVPGLQAVYNNDAQLEYVERWVTFGAWTQPDPCAPVSQGGGPNPSRPGECKLDPDLTAGSTFTSFSCQAGKQCGRRPDVHGAYKNAIGWESDLAEVAWPVYRNRW